MHFLSTFRRMAMLIAFATASSFAGAAPVQLSYTGQVSGYFNVPTGLLDAYAPVGTAMSLSLSFNETITSHPPGVFGLPAGDLGPVSGLLQVGSHSFNLDSAIMAGASFPGGTLSLASIRFMGDGDVPAGMGLFGLTISFSTDLDIGDPIRLGFSDGPFFRYLEFSGSGEVTALNAVPAPATLALVSVALLALGLGRARRPQH